jgi:hypothetical protein
MIDIINKYADELYTIKGKRVYIEIISPYFHGFADLGIIHAVTQDNTDIEIYGENDNFSMQRLGLKVVSEYDLEDDEQEDIFLFMVKYPISKTYLYFFEYEKNE